MYVYPDVFLLPQFTKCHAYVQPSKQAGDDVWRSDAKYYVRMGGRTRGRIAVEEYVCCFRRTNENGNGKKDKDARLAAKQGRVVA